MLFPIASAFSDLKTLTAASEHRSEARGLGEQVVDAAASRDGNVDRGPCVQRDGSTSHSTDCYSTRMLGREEVLREVMLETGTTQSELSRISGVRQPSISQFLSGRTPMSDEMLDRLLSCMGYRLEIVRRPVKQNLGRSPERSWRLHRQLSMHLTPETLDEWRPTILRNLDRLRGSVRGQPHLRNLDRWQRLIEDGDVPRLRRVMTGLDTDSVQMREVSPMSGLLPQEERDEVLLRAS